MIAAAALLAAAAQAPAGLQPAATADIVTALRACMAASGPQAVDTARLVADGWRAGSTQDGKGAAVASALGFWGHADNDALILTMPGQPLCTVMARIERIGRYPAIREALGKAIGGRVAERQSYQQIWIADGRVFQLAATGSDQAPSVRVSVMRMKDGR